MRPVLVILVMAVAFLVTHNAAARDDWTPFTIVNGQITLPAIVAGVETTAVINGNANVNGVSLELVEQAGLRTGKHTITVTPAPSRENAADTLALKTVEHAFPDGTAIELEAFVLREISLGPYTLQDVRASVLSGESYRQQLENLGRHEPTASVMDGYTRHGSIGLDVLGHFIVTFDYPEGLMHIEDAELVRYRWGTSRDFR